MGKADNIKRAKKLKEAKRKREQDALISAGLGPASKILQKRNAENGIETKLNDSKIKYSELLTKFIQPILNKNDTINIIKTKYTFGFEAWNAAIIREYSEIIYQEAKNKFISIMPHEPRIAELFEELAKRKQEDFLEFKNIFTDIEITKVSGLDYDLTVATSTTDDIKEQVSRFEEIAIRYENLDVRS